MPLLLTVFHLFWMKAILQRKNIPLHVKNRLFPLGVFTFMGYIREKSLRLPTDFFLQFFLIFNPQTFEVLNVSYGSWTLFFKEAFIMEPVWLFAIVKCRLLIKKIMQVYINIYNYTKFKLIFMLILPEPWRLYAMNPEEY